MPPAYRVQVIGVRETVAALRKVEDTTMPAAFRAGMEDAAVAAEERIRAVAPRMSGRLAGKITHRLQAGPVPAWAKVSSPATRSSKKYPRFNYGRLLEFGPRSRHRQWMVRGFEQAQGRVQNILQQVLRRIESSWP